MKTPEAKGIKVWRKREAGSQVEQPDPEENTVRHSNGTPEIAALRRERPEGQKLKPSLGYTTRSRPAWAT